MEVSRCCKKYVYVYSGIECTSFYLCSNCNKACDTMVLSKGVESHYGLSCEKSSTAAIDQT